MSVATVAARSAPLAGSPPEARPIPLRRALRPRRAVRHLTFAGVALVVAGLVGVLPYDTWRNQSNDLHTAGARLTALSKENTELQRQQRLLETDAEVSRIARQELGLAPAGADVYAIPDLRPGDATLTGDAALPVPARPAPQEPARRDRSTLANMWDAISFWD